MKPIYLFANWKMYLDYDESNILANAISNESKKIPPNVKMVIFPSALSLYPVGQVLNDVGIGIGAQNIYWVDKGGYTGEISAQMYKSAGCDYALIGHSERRHQFRETNHEIRQKIEAAIISDLTPVLCVGETQEERNNEKTDEVIEVQLRSAFDGLSWPREKELFIAYEPVWAIGTGNSCDPAEAQRMHQLINKITVELLGKVSPIILYGGSVRSANIINYIAMDSIDGVLVGGASSKIDSWIGMAEKVKNLS